MKKKIMAMALAFFMAVAPLQTFAAQNITTSKASISRHTDVDTYTVQVNSAADGTASVQASGGALRTFRVFAQGTRSAYIRRHGCAASALTCVLSGYTDKYADYTPEKTSRRIFPAGLSMCALPAVRTASNSGCGSFTYSAWASRSAI